MDILLKGINISIESFVNNIINAYSLPSSEKKKMVSMWNNVENIGEKSVDNIEEKLSSEKILKSNVSGLKSLCKKYNLKRSGKKEILIQRLIDHMNSPNESKPVLKKIKKIKKIKKQDDIGIIQIKRNQFGNYEHFETGLVFSKLDKNVIGKQNENGTITELNKNDIELCNKFKFKYILPENLNDNNENDEDSDSDSDLEEDIEEPIEEEFTEEEYFSD